MKTARFLGTTMLVLLITLTACTGAGSPESNGSVIPPSISRASLTNESDSPFAGPNEQKWISKLEKEVSGPAEVVSASQIKSLEGATFQPTGSPKCRETGCSLGSSNASKTWLVVGDSHAWMWVGGFEAITKKHSDIRVVWFGAASCNNILNQADLPPVGFSNLTAAGLRNCERMHRQVRKFLDANDPDVTIFSDEVSFLSSSVHAAAYRQGYLDWLNLARERSRAVVVLGRNPTWPNPADCLNRDLTNAAQCAGDTEEAEAANRFVSDLVSSAGAKLVATHNWFCYDGVCPLFIGNIAVTSDGGHISQAIARGLADVLYESVSSQD